jgi:hypothetical protein
MCVFESSKANTSFMAKLTKSKLLELCKSVAKHNLGRGECILLISGPTLSDKMSGSVTRGAQNGDWLRTLEGQQGQVPPFSCPFLEKPYFLLGEFLMTCSSQLVVTSLPNLSGQSP